MNALLARDIEFSELFPYAPLVFLFFFLTLYEVLCSSTFCVLNSALGVLFPGLFFISYLQHHNKYASYRKKGRQEGLKRKAEHCCSTQPLFVQGVMSREPTDTCRVCTGCFLKRTIKILWPLKS